jgi:outer membrane protein OmpA-like peptidoglycan-associated protein
MGDRRRLIVAATIVVLVANLGFSAAHGQAPTPTPALNIVNLQPRVIDLQPRVIDIAPKVSQQGGQTQLSVESDVLFGFDSANLGPDAQPVLAQVIAKLRTAPAGTVLIVGYTDSIGDDNYNLDLSRRRAGAVQAYLQAQVGRSELTYQTDGKGRSDPVAPNTRPDGGDNPDGRRLNRRVTITYAG